jgi:O-antigen chain-terminating methyltransferase
MVDSFYRSFEEHHRGSRELIKSRLRAYSSFIVPLARALHPVNAIDVGCGRGEWLELLGEWGIDAAGVDLDHGMLEACRQRGLQARHADAIAALREIPDGSIALVSAFHVVEHMPFEDVRTLLREALRALRPGGLLILETPNPENLVVGASEFYKDPSHARPIPWELLRFATTHAGFSRSTVMRLQESPTLRTPSPVNLIDVLGGASPDYAIVAQKQADGVLLAEFDAPFNSAYGISLDTLARRYDDQLETRIAMLERSAKAMESNAAAHHEDAETRIAALEMKLTRLDRQFQDLLTSRSWRVTAPLRFAGTFVRKLADASRPTRIAAGSKRTAKALLRRCGHAVMARPALRRVALSLIDRMPRLKYRLRGIMNLPGAPAEAAMLAQRPEQLPPRARQLYVELKRIIENKTS